jgi:protein-S-isoprenylcysteine O-methyltransferase Ste14
MQQRLIIKAIIITLLLPGSGILIIPYLILQPTHLTEWPPLSIVTAVGVIIVLVALAVLLHSIWGFAFYGRGTLAPIDPPKILVVRGLFRFTRNPMYLSIVIILLSEAWIFRSISLLIYALLAFLGFHLFVIGFEEPRLRAQFSASYEAYKQMVPRWSIASHAFKKE